MQRNAVLTTEPKGISSQFRNILKSDKSIVAIEKEFTGIRNTWIFFPIWWDENPRH
jgi:hypothetical protein